MAKAYMGENDARLASGMDPLPMRQRHFPKRSRSGAKTRNLAPRVRPPNDERAIANGRARLITASMQHKGPRDAGQLFCARVLIRYVDLRDRLLLLVLRARRCSFR